MIYSDSHPLLAREGWTHISLSVLAAIIVTVFAGWLWALPLWVFLIFVLQFFRDPKRTIPQTENVVVSPADGKIVALEKCEDPYLSRTALKISVFMNVFSVHSNRSPVSGLVTQVNYYPGKFINAELDKASEQNERNAIVIKTDLNQNITCVQVAGLIARRILCYAKQNEELARGQRYGFIRFGSRVDVYLPENSNSEVRLGQWVSAGSDILAFLDQTG